MAALEELSLRPSPASSALRLPRPLLPEGETRFRSYNRWLQEKFGERVYKVIVDAGFTCPNRDGTVRRVNRGHDYGAFLRAMEMTQGRSIHIGAHLILGFPWETREQWLAMADEISRVGVEALKIHHLHIVRGTALAAEYARRPFPVLGYEEYLDLLCDFIERLDPNIVIERMFVED